MTRITIIDRADMDAEQARVYDAAKNSGGVVGGPYYAYIRLPKLFETAQNLRTCLRSGPLSGREGQIINLVVARHWNAQYPWCAQVRGAIAVGLEQTIIDAINARQIPEFTDERERTCFVVSRELLANKVISDETYAAADKAMGLTDLIALIATTGNFSTTCMTANAFEVDPPADAPTPLAK
jgi:4-carboxymuconolactone decarboxylase